MAKAKGKGRGAVRTPQRSIINLKGSDAYQEWLAGLSKRTHIPIATIVRLALADWAAKGGHPAGPEK
jgi:hypothetical protein